MCRCIKITLKLNSHFAREYLITCGLACLSLVHRGDVLSKVVDPNEYGFVVNYNDVAAVATAIDA